MLEKYLTLLVVILPALIHAGIVIKIKPTKKGDDTSVDFLGEDLSEINDMERKFFKIDEESLKNASKIFIGKRCTNVFVQPPTPWGNVYKQFGWDPVRTTVKPIEAKVISVDTKAVTVGSTEYVNSHNALNVIYNTSVIQQVNETVEHTWKTGGESGSKKEITYEVNFGMGSVGGNTTLSYSGSWGEENKTSRKVTLGTTSSILTVVPPGNSIVASLIATQSTVDIEIRYSTTLTGNAFCNYHVRYHRHHFYSLPINQLQKITDIPLIKYSTEKVSVSFYTSVKLEVTNTSSTAS